MTRRPFEVFLHELQRNVMPSFAPFITYGGGDSHSTEKCSDVPTCDDLISRCGGKTEDWSCAEYDASGACKTGTCVKQIVGRRFLTS